MNIKYILSFILIMLIAGCGKMETVDNIEPSSIEKTYHSYSINPTESLTPDRYIVIFKKSLKKEKRNELLKNNSAEKIKDLKYIPAAVVKMSKGNVVKLKKNKDIEDIRIDIVMSASKKPEYKPNKKPDPEQILPWGIDRIDADLTASANIKGNGINVAVLDTGIDTDHPDLPPISGGYNFINNRKPLNYNDDSGHGTHCAGIIAALDNNIGVVGVAPEANLYALKVLDRKGNGYLSDLIDAVYWSVASFFDVIQSNDIGVISMSLSFPEEYTPDDFPYLSAAIASANAQGIILVAAAGNSGLNVAYPASDENVLAVSAIDSNDLLAYFSNFGPEISFAAPGVNIYSTLKGGSYGYMSGTSMAAPHVAGVAALLKESGHTDIIGENIGLPSTQQGAGLVDAYETVNQ